MLIAQWMPGNGEHVGPISTGPAVALLGVGGAAVLAAGVAAVLSRKGSGTRYFTGWLFGLGLTMCLLGVLGLLARHYEGHRMNDGLHAAGWQNNRSGTGPGPGLRHWRAGTHRYVNPIRLVSGGAATCRLPS